MILALIDPFQTVHLFCFSSMLTGQRSLLEIQASLLDVKFLPKFSFQLFATQKCSIIFSRSCGTLTDQRWLHPNYCVTNSIRGFLYYQEYSITAADS